MICYKDKTFCSFYENCNLKTDCHRALTPDIWAAANKRGLPVSMFLKEPECFNNKFQQSFQSLSNKEENY